MPPPVRPKKLAVPRPAFSLTAQQTRNLRFFAMAVGGSFLAFVVMGFVMTAAAPESEVFLISALVGPVIGVAAGRFLYGWPRLETRDGRALVNARAKPWLFFPVAAVAASLIYVVLGVFLTPILSPSFLAYVVLSVALVVGSVVAYLLVGFPRIGAALRGAWAHVPPERRPWLFFPLTALVGLVYYFGVGLAVTQTPIPLEIQPLLVLPLALALAAVTAYLLVGFPRPSKPLASYVPEVPGRQRPLAFFLTFLALGLPFGYVAGLSLNFAPLVPHGTVLPLALALGYVAALGTSAAVWGTPRRWRRFEDYKPGLPVGARRALFVPSVVGAAAIGAVATGVAGFDLFPGLLVGTAVGVLVGLRASGAMRDLRREGQRTVFPELPDMVKPLVLFPTWLLVGGVVFTTLLYVLPDLAMWHAVTAVVVGLVVALLLVEEPTLREWLDERKAEKARREEMRARRKQALAGPPKAR